MRANTPQQPPRPPSAAIVFEVTPHICRSDHLSSLGHSLKMGVCGMHVHDRGGIATLLVSLPSCAKASFQGGRHIVGLCHLYVGISTTHGVWDFSQEVLVEKIFCPCCPKPELNPGPKLALTWATAQNPLGFSANQGQHTKAGELSKAILPFTHRAPRQHLATNYSCISWCVEEGLTRVPRSNAWMPPPASQQPEIHCHSTVK